VVRCTFSPARAWRLAVGPASPPTLGLAKHAVQCSSRISACRRALNGHDGAAPQETVRRTSPRAVVSPCGQIGRHKDGRLAVGTTLVQPTKAALHRSTLPRGRPWPSVFSQLVRPQYLAVVRLRSRGSRGLECVPHHRRDRGAGTRRAGHQKVRSRRRSKLSRAERGLTPRSRRGPTALHLARAAPGVHDAPRGQGAIPLGPPQLER